MLSKVYTYARSIVRIYFEITGKTNDDGNIVKM